jgi:hypothetical protein
MRQWAQMPKKVSVVHRRHGWMGRLLAAHLPARAKMLATLPTDAPRVLDLFIS